MRKEIECNECDAEFKISYNLEESYYEINFCPFCGKEIWEEDEQDVEEEDE
jgi:peptide subunit release factor 1 (eRF1)